MSGESRQKVNLEELIESLVLDVRAVDANDSMTRSEKTKQMYRIADRFRNRLHDDGRRKDSDKIALSTYRKYMTMARRAITLQNWKHHSLDEQVQRLARKYPEYSDRLLALGQIDGITELRLAHRDFLARIRDNNAAYEDIRRMKLDHEIMRHLVLPSASKSVLAEETEEALETKKTDTVELNYHALMSGVLDLLTKKTKTVGDQSAHSFSRLALGIALATGRRAIEVLKQGDFRKIDSQRLEFSGQAKKRGGADPAESYTIYSLVDADIVLHAIENLRNLPEIKALDVYEGLGELMRNDAINKRCAKTLNTTAKLFFGSDSRVFKDSRAIYARICHELFFRRDPRWKKKDEDVFFRELLGHEDTETQKSYKQFKIEFDEPETDEQAEGGLTRSDALAALDTQQAITTRGSMQKLHDWVKARIAKDPEANITQSILSREVGSNRAVIKEYLELAKEALDARPGRAAVVEVPAIPPAPAKESKPKMRARQVAGGEWEGLVLIDDEVVARVQIPGDRADALKAAWAVYNLKMA